MHVWTGELVDVSISESARLFPELNGGSFIAIKQCNGASNEIVEFCYLGI